MGKQYYFIQGATFIYMSNSSGAVDRKVIQRRKRSPRTGSLALRISRSLVDSCLDCRVHEATFPTHNREVFLVTTSAMCGQALQWRMSGPVTAKFLHESRVMHSSDTSSTWDSNCHDDSLVIKALWGYVYHYLHITYFMYSG